MVSLCTGTITPHSAWSRELVFGSITVLSAVLSSMSKDQICTSPNCKEAAKLQCPTCIKLNIKGSYFCSQACFKSNWSTHKALHQPYDPWPYYSFSGTLRPFPLTEKRQVPPHIMRPDYADHPEGESACEEAVKGRNHIKVLDDEEIEGVQLAGKLAREVLEEAALAVAVGVTTDELDSVVHEACIERECYPSPLNYYNFPKSCCTSVNEVICHGIPDLRPLADGDIVNIDITIYKNGFHGDLNETLFVGNVSDQAKKLVRVTHECLGKAMALIKPGEKYRELGNVIQKHAQTAGFSVVRRYCGHGIHRLFHCAPNVPHYAKNKAFGVMQAGHCFTIEPMISEGSWKDNTWPDDWTAVTQDGKLSAQFEQTFLVTESGYEILTRRRTGGGRPYFMDQLESGTISTQVGGDK